MGINIIGREDIIWLAGVFDGEGHFAYSKSTHKGNGGAIYAYYYPSMQLANTDMEYLKMIRLMVGAGQVYTRRLSHSYSSLTTIRETTQTTNSFG